jgi:signal transduction histidine kinase
MFEDGAGRVWLGAGGRLLAYEQGRFVEAENPEGSPLGHIGTVWAITGDGDGDMWAGVTEDGKNYLLRIRGRTRQEEIPLDESVRRAESLAADRQGGVWVGAARDKLAHYRDGKMETVPLVNEGTVIVYSIFVDSDDALWAATANGMYRWKDGVLTLLDSRNGLPCSPVYSAIYDDYGNLWLYAGCGLLKVPASDVANWRSFPDGKVSCQTFDALDGALPGAGAVYQRRAQKSPDGRLWFTNGKAAQVIDPGRTYTNTIPPPVHIEGLIADHRSYPTEGRLSLPPLGGELEIDYTALCFTVPRKVKFRYRLEGHDADWHDAGTRRQAFYNNLGPGQYRFRVIASNDGGAWNEVGAALDFSIAPTWYQTTSFRILCLLSVGLIAWVLYRLRIRQVARAMSARFDARLDERTRLARELHDTFLQTVQGSKLVADDALEQSGDPVRTRRALEKLSAWLGQATEEGRAALDSLRTSTTETNDLAEAFRRATEDCQGLGSTEVVFSVVGDARDMHPIIRDEIYRIGYEAIRNACVHSGASRLEVELRYAQDLVVRVSDDGRGIDPAVAENGKPGHFGLQGMRERAARIGARLSLASSANSGTHVTVVVPGSVVYRGAGAAPSDWIKDILGR